jgi:hypothetical protein
MGNYQQCVDKCPGCHEDDLVLVTAPENPAFVNGGTGGSEAATGSDVNVFIPHLKLVPVLQLPSDAQGSGAGPSISRQEPPADTDETYRFDQPTPSAGDHQGEARTAGEWVNDQRQFAHLPPLPDGWIRVRSRSSGEIYYCNVTTGDTTFDEPTKPAEVPSDVPLLVPRGEQSADLAPGWEQMVSRTTGQIYYWNEELDRSQYEKPLMENEMSAAASREERLLPGWEECVSKSKGTVYYWNAALQESTFVKPTAGGAVNTGSRQMAEDLPPGWCSQVSRSTGKTFYYNTETNVSQFERPTGRSKEEASATNEDRHKDPIPYKDWFLRGR